MSVVILEAGEGIGHIIIFTSKVDNVKINATGNKNIDHRHEDTVEGGSCTQRAENINSKRAVRKNCELMWDMLHEGPDVDNRGDCKELQKIDMGVMGQISTRTLET